MPNARSLTPRQTITGLATVAAAGLLYAHLETKWFALRRVQVPVLAEGSKPVRILQLADLHLGPHQHRKLRWLASLAALQPDLVVNTGDNWTSARSQGPLLDALADLLRLPGVFVLGSNDFYPPHLKNPARYIRRPSQVQPRGELPWQELVAAFTSAGWLDADNRRGQVTLHDGRVIEVVGTGDAHLGNDQFPTASTPSRPVSASSAVSVVEALETTEYATEGGTAPRSALRLGVTHAPYRRVLDEFYADGTQLVIAGHTHGGQLCVPGYGALTTNCDLDTSRASGLHTWPGSAQHEWPGSAQHEWPGSPLGNREQPMWLHVSAGAGTSPYAPFRFACRPEANLLTLVARPSPAE